MPRHLLFTSSRDGVTEADVEATLHPLFAPDKVLVAGGARGGDRIAAQLWRAWGGQVDEHPVKPVEWQRSRGAGYRRNAEMVAKVKAAGDAECLAVIARCASPKCTRPGPHGTHGAVHCAGLAAEAGLPVTRVKAGAQQERDMPRGREALQAAGVTAVELEAGDQIRSELTAWHEWNRAVHARAAAGQQAQEGAQEMLGRRNPQARQQTEADRLFAEADRLDDLTRRPDHQQQITAERAARIRERIGGDLVHDARAQAETPGSALTGGDLDAEVDRLAEMYPEPEAPGDEPFGGAPLPDYVTELDPGAYLIEMPGGPPPRSQKPERAPRPEPESAWDRYVTSQPGSDEHKAAYVEMHREAGGGGFADPDPDRGYLMEHGYVREADRWAMPGGGEPETAASDTASDPLPRVLEPEESAAAAPDPTHLPDGLAHPSPLLAERGWETQGGWYVRQPEHQLEAG